MILIMLRIILYFAVIFCNWNVRGAVYEEGTFFKYEVLFDNDIEVPNISEKKDEFHVLLNGSWFKCSFYSEKSLYNLYNPRPNKDYFSALTKSINKLLNVSTIEWSYFIFPGYNILPVDRIFQRHNHDIHSLYSLGVYNHSYFHKEKIGNFSEKEQMYFTEVYVNGTLCKATGLPRTSEIRYVCRLSEKEELVNVVEISSCKYVFYVHTFRVCLLYGSGFENVFQHPIYCESEGKETVNDLVKTLGTEDILTSFKKVQLLKNIKKPLKEAIENIMERRLKRLPS